MSLLSQAYEEMVMIDKTTTEDGRGGVIPTWKDGAKFKAAVVLNSTMQARIGEKQGVTALYTITTNKSINLQYHDIFRRTSDGKIFRVTSDGDDEKTPASASLDMRQVSAEEWKLTDYGQTAGTL